MVETATPRLRVRREAKDTPVPKKAKDAQLRPFEPRALAAPTLLRQSRPERSCSVEGYGSKLVRRILQDLGWREVDPDASPHLVWNGSTTGRKLLKGEVFKPWQLLNHFPRSGAMGSKSALLWNLRDYCSSQMALMSFMPRSYDLRSPRELRAFLLDFAVTKAESMLGPAKAETAAGVLQACRLLGRLSHAQVLQSQVLCGLRASFREQEGVVFSHEDEWVWDPGGAQQDAEAALLLSRLAAEKEGQEGLIFSALTLEAHWWREHLQKEEHRQTALNGNHGFWILKEPNLNCGRGVHVFSSLLPLLQEAERADWNVVIQKYIERPLLIRGRKCDVRLWVAITSWNPAVVFVWPEPYLRLASRHFTWENTKIDDPFVHLTNRSVQRHDVQSSNQDEDEDHIMLLPAFLKWVEEMDSEALSCWKERTWPRILEVVRSCVLCCKEDVGAHPAGCFEIFGFDFLLDSDLTPWLLEANSSPDLCEDAGPSLRRMTETALSQLFELLLKVQLPGTGHFDETVSGSGDWHLILREEIPRGIKELELRRAVRASRRPPSVSTAQSRTQHRDVMRTTLGGSQVKREPKDVETCVRMKELVLLPSPGSGLNSKVLALRCPASQKQLGDTS